MENFVNDMWKNVGGMNSMMKDVDPSKIGLKVIEFQKNTFSKTYDAAQQLQEHAEKIMEPILNINPAATQEWSKILKKNQEEMKSAIDKG